MVKADEWTYVSGQKVEDFTFGGSNNFSEVGTKVIFGESKSLSRRFEVTFEIC